MKNLTLLILAILSLNQFVYAQDIASLEIQKTIEVNNWAVSDFDVFFNETHQLIAYSNNSNVNLGDTLVIYDFKNDQILSKIPGEEWNFDIQFINENQLLYLHKNAIYKLDNFSSPIITKLTEDISLQNFIVSPDKSKLIAGYNDKIQIYGYDFSGTLTLEKTFLITNNPNLYELSISGDNMFIAASGGYDKNFVYLISTEGNTIDVVSTSDHGGTYSPVFFKQNGNLKIAVGGAYTGGSIEVIDVSSKTLEQSVTAFTHYNYSLAVNPDQTYLVCGGFDATVRLFKIGDHSFTDIYSNYMGMVAKLKFSQDGAYVISGYQAGSAKLVIQKVIYKIDKNVEVTAGNLKNVLTAEELKTCSKLTLTGTIDARDFKTMRDDMPLLAEIDLSSVNIVDYSGSEGTEPYNSILYAANSIPDFAFYNYFTQKGKTSLNKFVFPKSATTIRSSAFQGCIGFALLIIPETITSIGPDAFLGCSPISVDTNNPNYLSSDGVLFNKYQTVLIYCPSTKTGSFSIPESVTSIGYHAFLSCENLTSVTIPTSVVAIDQRAFDGCKGLVSITIPSSVKSIEFGAFYGCSNLASIIIERPIPLDLSSNPYIFYGVNKSTCSLYVPYGSKAAYQAADQWQDFSNIVEMSGVFITPTSIVLGADEKNYSFMIASSSSWSASSDQEWLAVKPVNGTSGHTLVLISATTNEEATSRLANLKISAVGFSDQLVTVMQYGKVNITAGGLRDAFGGRLESITKLTLTGTIDARDFKTMRDDMPLLAEIDLSGATIVAYTGTEGTWDTDVRQYPENTLPDYSFFSWIRYDGKHSLRSIKLPASVTVIGDAPFNYCTQLSTIYLNSRIPGNFISLNDAFFLVNKTTCTLYVPYGSKAAYQDAAQWQDFQNIVEADSGFYVNVNAVNLAAVEGSSVTVNITANVNWSASTDQPWLTVNPVSGSGNQTLSFTAQANNNFTSRTAIVTVSADGVESQTITVTQEKMPAPSAVVKKANTAPVIDGVVDAIWADANVYNIDRNFINESVTLGASGETNWKALWNDDGIYILIQVTDDVFSPAYAGTTSSQDYMYDKPEIYFDVNAVKSDGRGPGTDANLGTTGHYHISPTFMELFNDGTPVTLVDGVIYSLKVNNPNYVGEYFIPFSKLIDEEGNYVFKDQPIGFDITIIDNDSADPIRNRAVWANTGVNNESWANMDDAGTITLEGAEPNVLISAINLTGGTITDDNGTLQILPEILPANASNKTLKWSVVVAEGSNGKATINSLGVLTAILDGVVTVTAKTTDGTGISSSVNVTISGQVPTYEEVNIIRNGNFDLVEANGMPTFWGGWVDGNYGASYLPCNVTDGVAILANTQEHPTENWHYQFWQSNLTALPNIAYVVSFDAWADNDRQIGFDFEDTSENAYNRYGFSSDPESVSGRSEWSFHITTEPTRYTFHVTFDQITPTTIQAIKFFLSQGMGTVYIDNVSIISETDLLLVDGKPVVSTLSVSSITPLSVICESKAASIDKSPIIEKGVCWSISANPTIADSKTSDGNGNGNYTSNITGLIPNTTYFVRAYATNDKGTSYGNNLTFTTTDCSGIGLVGSFNNWGSNNSDVLLEPAGNGECTWNVIQNFSDNGEVKFRRNYDWNINWGDSNFPGGVAVQNGPDIPITAGTYLVSFNSITGEYNFESVSIKCNQQDSLALVAIYNATNGANWGRKDNWLTGKVQSWYGVTLNMDGRVTGLNLAYNRLSGYIPAEIGNLTELKKLCLGNNMFVTQYYGWNNLNQQALPQSLQNLVNLEILSLDQLSMNNELPDIFGGMTSLKELYIQNSNFTNQSLPGSIASCANLEKLQFYYNNFYDLPDMSGLNKLNYVDASGCYFDFADIELNLWIPNFYYSSQRLILGSIEALSPAFGETISRTINVSGANNIYQWLKDGQELAGQMTNTLTLENIDISDAGIYTLRVTNNLATQLILTSQPVILYQNQLPLYNALEALYNSTGGNNWNRKTNWLSNQPITTWEGIYLDNWNGKYYLELWNNNLIGSLPEEFGELSFFYRINIYENRGLTGSIPSSIGQLSNLEEIYLPYNNLSGAIPAEIKNCTNLRYINIYDNQINGLPTDLTGMNLYGVSAYNNKLEFDDIIPWMGKTQYWFNYSPQKKYGEVESIPLAIGTSVIFNGIAGGEGNVYQWYKNNELMQGQTGAELVFASLTAGDEGTYFCQVTNPAAPNLTLVSEPKTLYDVSKLDSYEHDNYFATAQEITGADYQQRSLFPAGDRDIAWFEITQPSQVQIWMSNGDWGSRQLTVYGTDTTTVLTSGSDYCNFVTIEPGIYYVKAWSQNSEPIAEYFLDIEITPFTIDAYEPDNTVADAKQIYPFFPQTDHNLKPLNDQDYVKFDITDAPRTVTVDVFNETSCRNFSLWLYGTDGATQLAYSDWGAKNCGAKLQYTIPENGTYYIKTKVPWQEMYDNYTISVVTDGQPPVIACNQQDSLALVAIYNATNGAYWGNKTNWLTGNVQTWYGVTMNMAGRVTGLNLAANNLNGYIPSEIGNLTEIKKLILGNNRFVNQWYGRNYLNRQALPQTMANLTKLEVLALDQVYMYNELPDIFGGMSELKELYIDNSYFTNQSLPVSITSCSNLEILYAYYNNFYDLPDLSGLTKLNRFYAYGCFFSFEDIEPNLSISNFSYGYQRLMLGNVESINPAAGETVTRTIMVGGANNIYQWLKDGIELTGQNTNTLTLENVDAGDAGFYTLRVTNSQATQLILASQPIILYQKQLPVYKALEALYNSTGGDNWNRKNNWLTNEPITSWEGIGLDSWNGLYYLNLYDNNLVGTLPQEIGDLSVFYNIEISNNPGLTGEIPTSVGNLTKLQNLYLHNSNLSGAIPAEIKNCTSLKYFYFDNNKISGLPSDLSGMNLYGVTAYNNKLEFDDIIPWMGKTQDWFEYSPQDSIGESLVYDKVPGEALSHTLITPGDQNQYQWYKDGVLLDGKTNATIEFGSLSLYDTGKYYCLVTNPQAPDLTLVSRIITIKVVSGANLKILSMPTPMPLSNSRAFCGLSNNEPITVKFTNTGEKPVSGFTLGYSVDGGQVAEEIYSSVINPGDTVDYVFGNSADLSFDGYFKTYNIKCYVVFADDNMADNEIARTRKTFGNYTDMADWTTYNSCDGMLSDISWAIAEDKNGNIWSTDFYGASKFDGTNWTTYTTADGLGENYNWAMINDVDGNIWFAGSNGSVITKYDGSQFIKYPQPGTFEECIYQDSKGNIWFGSWNGSGVAKFDGNNWSYYPAANYGLGNNVVSIGEDKNGKIYFSTNNGVVVFDGTNWNQLTWPGQNSYINEIFVDSKENIWFAGNESFYKFNGITWSEFTTNDGAIYTDDITEDKYGNIWFGGGRKIVKYDGNTFTRFTATDGLAAATAASIYSIHADKNGDIWVGTYYGGISKLEQTQTDCPRHFHTVWEGTPGFDHMNINVIGAKYDGFALEPGDEVGVFDGNLCVGYGKVTQTISDQNILTIKVSKNDGTGNGFVNGNEVTYRIWDCSESAEYTVQDVTCYNTELNAITCSPFEVGGTSFVELSGRSEECLTLSYRTGWNLFSVPVEIDTVNLTDVFQAMIADKSLVKIQDELGSSLENWGIFGGWKNNIGDVRLTEGYKIKVNRPDSIRVCGSSASYPYAIPLQLGWNIIGYPQIGIYDASAVMQQLIDRKTLIKVQDEMGSSLENWGIFGGWKNNIGSFNPGEGYKVKVNAKDTLWIRESYVKSTVIEAEYLATSHFRPDFTGNGVDQMNLNVVNLPVHQLEAGDELAVYDGDKCVGAVQLTQQHLTDGTVQIIASANDGQSEGGFTEGLPFSIKLWSSLSGEEYVIRPEILQGTMLFTKHETTVASLEKYVTTGFGEIAGAEVTTVNCYPNPFSDEVTIEIGLQMEAEVEVEVLNQLGQRVKYVTTQQKLPAGIHKLSWNGRSASNQEVSPGVYHLRISIDDSVNHRKIIMSK